LNCNPSTRSEWTQSVDPRGDSAKVICIELEIAGGLSPEEARCVALRMMDGLEKRKEECRDMRRVNFLDDLLRDLRYAGPSLRRGPGFATLAF